MLISITWKLSYVYYTNKTLCIDQCNVIHFVHFQFSPSAFSLCAWFHFCVISRFWYLSWCQSLLIHGHTRAHHTFSYQLFCLYCRLHHEDLFKFDFDQAWWGQFPHMEAASFAFDQRAQASETSLQDKVSHKHNSELDEEMDNESQVYSD